MKRSLSVVVVAILLFSCAEDVSEKKEIKPDPTPKVAVAAVLDGCYEMIIGSDTAFMKIEEKSNLLNGTLSYKRKDKDSNSGNVSLTKTAERAEGFYTFQSEGKTSVRQIVFKIGNSNFAEGYGDIVMKNDTAVFKYPHALNFEEKHAFNKITCK